MSRTPTHINPYHATKMVGGSIFPVQKHSPPTIRPVPLGARANLRASHGNNKLELRVMTISRSENMRRIQGKDTKPEMVVRSLLRSLGYPGYRLHRSDLPGKPDVAYIGRQKAIVINGCFWHGHDCKKGSRRPKSNQDYWLTKISKNQKRDAINQAALLNLGWDVLILWECELRNQDQLAQRLKNFLSG